MMQTAPLDERLDHRDRGRRLAALLPGVRRPGGGRPAGRRRRSAAAWHAQLLIAQRADGELTIGDTHVYDEPYDFAVEDEPYEHLHARAESILGRSAAAGRASLGGGLLAGHRRVRRACASRRRPGLVIVTGSRRARDDAVARHRGRDARRDGLVIRLAVLDMAGTTVRDGGVVERSFVEALGDMGFDPDGAELQAHFDYVRATMGQSKITVFRSVFGGDEEQRRRRPTGGSRLRSTARCRAARSSRCRGARPRSKRSRARGVRICLTTGFSSATREQLIDVLGWRDLVDLSLSPERRRAGASVPRPDPDRAHAAGDRRGAGGRGGRRHDERPRRRDRGRARPSLPGVLTGAHDRARLSAAPHTHILESIAELPPCRTSSAE